MRCPRRVRRESAAQDARAIEVLGRALEGSDRPLSHVNDHALVSRIELPALLAHVAARELPFYLLTTNGHHSTPVAALVRTTDVETRAARSLWPDAQPDGGGKRFAIGRFE